MMTPQRGTTLATLIRSVLDELRANRVMSVSGGQLKRTPNGTHIIVQPGMVNRPEKAGDELRWGGVYSQLNRGNCKKNHIYVLPGGPNRGTYLCLVDGPKFDPWEGQEWVLFTANYDSGEWV